MKIKNWKKFQHFKNRRPPWIKLHREILDQRDINMMSDSAFRVLIGLWLLAAEDPLLDGNLPSIDDIAYRLRIKKDIVIKALPELISFVYQDDIKTISTRHQLGPPETETETETETDSCAISLRVSFLKFWKEYPRKKSKGNAEKIWNAIKPDPLLLDAILSSVKRAKTSEDWRKDCGQFIPYPASWLRSRGWEDENCTEIYRPSITNFLPEKPLSDSEIKNNINKINELVKSL